MYVCGMKGTSDTSQRVQVKFHDENEDDASNRGTDKQILFKAIIPTRLS